MVDLKLKHPLYKEVFEKVPKNLDLPHSYSNYELTDLTKTNKETLSNLQGGTPFLSRYKFRKGHLYLCTSPLKKSTTNFMDHALFVTSLLRIAEYSRPTHNLYYTIGESSNISLKKVHSPGDNVFHLQKAENDIDIIPEHRQINGTTNLKLHDQIKEAGNYELLLNNKLINGIAFNYPRKESDLKNLSEEKIAELLNKYGLTHSQVLKSELLSKGKSIEKYSEGTNYWWHSLVLVLFFLLCESLLLNGINLIRSNPQVSNT
ncbi:MAG: hypothetical protein ABEH43_08195 [Flavobacteriales bacterium]